MICFQRLIHCSDDEENYGEEEGEEEVDELDFRDEGQYWLTDSNLVVEESVAFSVDSDAAFSYQQQKHHESITKLAVDRLKG